MIHERIEQEKSETGSTISEIKKQTEENLTKVEELSNMSRKDLFMIGSLAIAAILLIALIKLCMHSKKEERFQRIPYSGDDERGEMHV